MASPAITHNYKKKKPQSHTFLGKVGLPRLWCCLSFFSLPCLSWACIMDVIKAFLRAEFLCVWKGSGYSGILNHLCSVVASGSLGSPWASSRSKSALEEMAADLNSVQVWSHTLNWYRARNEWVNEWVHHKGKEAGKGFSWSSGKASDGMSAALV